MDLFLTRFPEERQCRGERYGESTGWKKKGQHKIRELSLRGVDNNLFIQVAFQTAKSRVKEQFTSSVPEFKHCPGTLRNTNHLITFQTHRLLMYSDLPLQWILCSKVITVTQNSLPKNRKQCIRKTKYFPITQSNPTPKDITSWKKNTNHPLA